MNVPSILQDADRLFALIFGVSAEKEYGLKPWCTVFFLFLFFWLCRKLILTFCQFKMISVAFTYLELELSSVCELIFCPVMMHRC